MYGRACADDVLELAACDSSVDEWQYRGAGEFWGLVVGSSMACWDGDIEHGSHQDGKPLRARPFEEPGPMGCMWGQI